MIISEGEGESGGAGKTRPSVSPSDPEPTGPPATSLRERAEAIWKLYPRKAGKKRALSGIIQFLKSESDLDYFPTLEDATREYARSREGEPERYTLHGSTFFGSSERFNDDPRSWWDNREKATPDPISYSEWCSLPDQKKNHRAIHPEGRRELYYLERGVPLPSGYLEGDPPRPE